jgi:hypothetical protein
LCDFASTQPLDLRGATNTLLFRIGDSGDITGA